MQALCLLHSSRKKSADHPYRAGGSQLSLCCYLTFILQVAFTLLPSLAFAVIVTVPFLTPVTLPEEDTFATLLLELDQVTPFVVALDGV